VDGHEFEVGAAGCDAEAAESQKECDGWESEVERSWESGGYENESYAIKGENACADGGRGEIWRGLLPSAAEHASLECSVGSVR
jgi:hypothetical protein